MTGYGKSVTCDLDEVDTDICPFYPELVIMAFYY